MDAMIDIETLGVVGGSVVLSIGYLEFDPRGNDDFLGMLSKNTGLIYQLDVEEQLALGYKKDPDTVEWWEKQGEDAKKAVLEAEPTHDLLEALEDLKKRLLDVDDIWSYGPMDRDLLNYMSHKELGSDLFFYRKYCDLRTLTKLMEFTWDEKPKGMVKHNPLHDCVYQALAVQKLMRS